MADIKFFANINLQNSELISFKVDNETSDPSGLTGEGQLIYRTDTNVLKYHTGSNNWVAVGTSSGSMSSWTMTGDSGGDAVITDGITVDIAGGTALSSTRSGNTLTVNHDSFGTAGTFAYPSQIITNAQGHVTSVTGGSAPGTMSSWILTADSGTSLTVTNGLTVDIAGGTGITTQNNATGTTITNSGVTEIAGTSPIAVDTSTGSVTISYTGGTGSMSSFTLAGSAGTNSTIANADTLSVLAGSNISTTGNGTDGVVIAYTGGTGSMSSWNLVGDTGSQSITNGNNATFTGGTAITTTASATDILTIKLDNTAVTAATYTSANITVDAQGRITSASDGGAGTMTSFILSSDSGSNQTVSNGETVDIAGGTFVAGVVSATNTVTLDLSATGTKDATTYLAGDNTFKLISAIPGTYTGWTLTGDTGSQTIASGNTVTATGGTGITTAVSATDVLTITNDGVTSNVAGTGISVSGATGAVTITNDGVTSLAGTSPIAVSASSGAVTISYSGGTGAMDSWNLAGDSGSAQSVTNGNTATFIGGTNIATVAGATDDLTINLDDSISLAGSLTVGTTATITGQLTIPAGSAGTSAVNLNQLNAAVVGLLEFKGGFNASTGAIVGGGNLTSGSGRVAIAVGDFYVVTVAGNFFGNASEPLSIGDQVIATTAAAVGSSVQSDFVEVQANIDIATTTTVGLVSVPTAGHINVTAGGAISLDNGAAASNQGSSAKTVTLTTNSAGQVTSIGEQDINITASQVSDFCAAVDVCVADLSGVATIGNGTLTQIDVTHSLGQDVIVQAVDILNNYAQIFPEIQRTSATNVRILTNTPIANNGAKVYIQKVS